MRVVIANATSDRICDISNGGAVFVGVNIDEQITVYKGYGVKGIALRGYRLFLSQASVTNSSMSVGL
jgi:hypothetical protein